MRAQIALAVNRGAESPVLLLKAAQRLEPLDAWMARDTSLEALSASRFFRNHAVKIAEAARLEPAPFWRLRPSEAVHVLLGELPEAAALVGQVAVLTEVIGVDFAPYGAVMLDGHFHASTGRCRPPSHEILRLGER